MPFSRLLVAVDASEASNRALDKALELAGLTGASVLALAVEGPLPAYAATIGEVDGVRLLAPETVAAASASQMHGPDRVLRLPTHFGLGFMLPPTLCADLPDGAFGHPGAGGSLGFADPVHGLAFGYAMNQMQLGLLGDPRAERLVSAAYASLSARTGR